MVVEGVHDGGDEAMTNAIAPLYGCPCGREIPSRLFMSFICTCGRQHNPPEPYMPRVLERIDELEQRVAALEAKNEEHKL